MMGSSIIHLQFPDETENLQSPPARKTQNTPLDIRQLLVCRKGELDNFKKGILFSREAGWCFITFSLPTLWAGRKVIKKTIMDILLILSKKFYSVALW